MMFTRIEPRYNDIVVNIDISGFKRAITILVKMSYIHRFPQIIELYESVYTMCPNYQVKGLYHSLFFVLT